MQDILRLCVRDYLDEWTSALVGRVCRDLRNSEVACRLAPRGRQSICKWVYTSRSGRTDAVYPQIKELTMYGLCSVTDALDVIDRCFPNLERLCMKVIPPVGHCDGIVSRHVFWSKCKSLRHLEIHDVWFEVKVIERICHTLLHRPGSELRTLCIGGYDFGMRDEMPSFFELAKRVHHLIVRMFWKNREFYDFIKDASELRRLDIDWYTGSKMRVAPTMVLFYEALWVESALLYFITHGDCKELVVQDTSPHCIVKQKFLVMMDVIPLNRENLMWKWKTIMSVADRFGVFFRLRLNRVHVQFNYTDPSLDQYAYDAIDITSRFLVLWRFPSVNMFGQF